MTGETQDLILVQRVLRGEEAAFDEFFEGYFPRLYRFALARLDRREDAAEEVVQVTMMHATSGMKSYRGEAALFTWLCTICRREIGAHQERHRRAPITTGLLEDSAEIRAVLDSLSVELSQNPEMGLQREEVARLVQVTLDALPPHYGDALEWKYIQGLSVKEIAERLRLGPKAAESMLTRARQAFREAFGSMAGQRGGVRHPAG